MSEQQAVATAQEVQAAPEAATSPVVVGVHAGHNSSVSCLEKGEIVWALQEERLTRIKNQGGIPVQALQMVSRRCEEAARNGATLQVGYAGSALVRFYWKRDELLQDYSIVKPSLLQWVKNAVRYKRFVADPIDRKRANEIGRRIRQEGGLKPDAIVRSDHHLTHAASAYYGWGRMDEPVLLLTQDGGGDGICASVSIGKNGRIERVAAIEQSHSVGRLYSNITYLMGMVPLEHEYKLMGLAPYAEKSQAANSLAAEFESWFEFERKSPMTWKRSKHCPAMPYSSRFIEDKLRLQRFDHVAGGLQIFLEKFLTAWVRACVRETGVRKVALSGGVFMNVKANQKILELPEVDELFVFPSCGDETNVFGSAWMLQRNLGRPTQPLSHLYLGPEFDERTIEEAIGKYRFTSKVRVERPRDIERTAAELLAKSEVVARFKGRMEFGARALGNRSILANASHARSVRIINEMIKSRDFWMPFAPSVLAEKSEQYFVKPKPMEAPYMIVTFDTRPEKRERIIAAIHPYDCTGRPQEVREEWNPEYYRLIKHYEELTGEALILNTSFNLHGEPVVCSPEDALRVFDISGLQHLAMGHCLLTKVPS